MAVLHQVLKVWILGMVSDHKTFGTFNAFVRGGRGGSGAADGEESEEISIPRHIGILQVANGGRRYTSVNPDVQRLTGCEEGTMRGVRLDL